MKQYLSCLPMLVAGVLLASCTSHKSADETSQEAAPANDSQITLADGSAEVFWLKDNPDNKLMDRGLFPEASDSLMEALGLTEGVPASISTFLMRCDGQWALFDTGLGAAHGGQLMAGLEAMGLTADSISILYLTHFHGDHIGGMVQEGQSVFQQAEVYASQREYDAWINEMPKEQTGMQQQAMALYQDRLHLFQFGDTLPHQVVTLDAVGHTPGHTAFQKSNLLVIGDLMHGAALQTVHPEISGNYDMDKAQASESRQRLLQYAKDQQLVMAGMHLPEPAFIK